uniref:BAH domain-containing protein n=1 Tax=Labrus bergylta TaxID=56723 RepID=A0A3Q3FUF8_9LABR
VGVGLGEFYFIRCGPQDPVCIAEVTLLWEDQTRRHLLASARLYFLPEDTPRGRTREHGEDEVLAVSRKIVLRVEDLVRWSCVEPTGWSVETNLETPACGTNRLLKSLQSNNNITNNKMSDLEVHSSFLFSDEQSDSHSVRILSYPQYCRFRSLQRRIQDGARGAVLQDLHLLALGGVKALPSTRLMYCRDTFSHPTLENNASFSWQFSE